MRLTKEQEHFYETTLEVARRDVEEADHAIQLELSRLKERLAELQNAKTAALQMYDAACMRLGRSNDLVVEDPLEELAISW